jgi:hypothetical protein
LGDGKPEEAGGHALGARAQVVQVSWGIRVEIGIQDQLASFEDVTSGIDIG